MSDLDRQRVVDHDWVNRYLRRELDAAQAESFEQYFLGCPETVEELELTRALMAPANWPRTSREQTLSNGWLSRLADWLTMPRLGPALAGGFAVLLIAPLLTTIVFYESRGERAGEISANDVVLGVPLTRSAATQFSAVVRGTAPGMDSNLVLGLELDYSEFPSHRVEVTRWPDQSTIAVVENLVLQGATGNLTLSLPGSLLKPGDYRAQVLGSADDGASQPIAAFDFSLD